MSEERKGWQGGGFEVETNIRQGRKGGMSNGVKNDKMCMIY